MFSKKGQGMPLTIVVIAAIALVVLIVLIVIFTGGVGRFGKGVEETTEEVNCNSLDGKCMEFCNSSYREILTKTECFDNPLKIHCCVLIGETEE